MAKAIYNYWFVQFDFPDENGKPYKTNHNDMIYSSATENVYPADWKIGSFSDLLSVLKDGTHNPPPRQEQGIPLLTGKMFGKFFLNYKDATYISEKNYSIIHKTYQPQVHDIILTKIGTVGTVNILSKADIPIAIHCNSALIRNNENCTWEYLFWLIKSPLFQARLAKEISKTVQDFVSLEKIANIKIEIPPLDLIQRFTTEISAIQHKIENLSNENNRLTNLRNWLFPMLMNGQATIEDCCDK